MDGDKRLTVVDGTEFYLSDNAKYVGETGTTLRWSPSEPRGYKMYSPDGLRWERIGLTSFGAFGTDICHARELAERWCHKAQRAWCVLTGAIHDE